MTRSRDFAKGATRSEFDYTATAGQTTFSGNDNDSESLSYTAGQIDVYLNGSHLNQTDDYVATNGTSVVLQSGAAAGDILHVVAYGSFNVANVVATRDLEGNEFILDDDGDTTITADTDDQIDIKIAGADDFKFTANTFHALDGSTVLIGGQSSDSVGGATCNLQLEGTSTADSSISLKCNANGTTAPTLRFGKSRGTSVGSDTVVQDGDELGVIVFAGADGTDTETQGAVIIAAVDGTPGANDLPTRLLFNTTADGASSTTERMRINSSGQLLIGTSSILGSSNAVVHVNVDKIATDGGAVMSQCSGTGDVFHYHFRNGNGGVGGIKTTGSSSAFVTSSDYRLKENVDYTFDATSRLKQLKPCRFNFIADADTTLDGFLAHEVSSIVPEAIHGTKDATKVQNVYDEDNNKTGTETVIDPQGIDQSKLVPLLVKTIQELEARITALENN